MVELAKRMTLRTKRLLKIAALLLAVLVVAYSALTIWSFVALHRAYAALKRDGRPMTAAEVIPPPIPAADNAAPIYEEAIQLLEKTKIGKETMLQVLVTAANSAIISNAPATDLSRFRELVARPEAGIAVLTYKKEHDKWPESLATCMEQLPIDPFDGKPLRYRLTEKGFVVSSVGQIVPQAPNKIAWEYEPAH